MAHEFDGDAFISYAHLDNLELVEGRRGWVDNLHRALEIRVGQLLGKSPHIWRDPKLHGNDLFAEKLVERLRHVAVLVTVVSPRYVTSEWTIRELKEFWAAAEAQGGIRVRDKARVFKVLKTPVPPEKTPPELKVLLGYEFFKVEPGSGKVRELDEVFGPEAQREFWIKLDDLAHDIVALLELLHEHDDKLRSAPSVDATGSRTSASLLSPVADRAPVYLAETTSDLREQRELLRRDLLQHGYSVLPTEAIPHVAAEAETVIRTDLARSRMSIHLIGQHYGVVPEGGHASLIELQHELATERSEDPRFERLLWIPSGLAVSDERQRHVIERLRADPRQQGRCDLLETMFEDLRTAVHDWLEREVDEPPVAKAMSTHRAHPEVYLIADQRDAEFILPWADALYDQQLEILRPLFDGDEAEIREYHEENLTQCDGVLIFYGAGNELWLRRKLRELQKSPGLGRTKPAPVVGICLVGARTPEKERLRWHDAIVIPQWDGVSLSELKPFISKLRGE